jgi:hypothetical protein
MKLKTYISLFTLLTACVFFTPVNIYAEKNNDKHKNDNNKKGNVQNKHSNNKNDNQKQGNVEKDNNRGQDFRDQTHHGNVQNNRPNVQQNKPKVQYNKNYVHYNGTPTNYEYRGRYRNFRNYNHTNRYFYGGNYYNFDDYYRHYSREGNVFTYEGAYRRHGNFFIFTDKYGNEFELYLKPVNRVPLWLKAKPLQYGRPYHISLKPTRYYATPDEMRIGLTLNFGWGNLSLQNTKYVDMQTAPELINVRGRLYIRD